MRARLRRLAVALRMEPGFGLAIERAHGKWWLTGCIGGDVALPQTATAHTVPEALEHVEAWLAPEITRLEAQSIYRIENVLNPGLLIAVRVERDDIKPHNRHQLYSFPKLRKSKPCVTCHVVIERGSHAWSSLFDAANRGERICERCMREIAMVSNTHNEPEEKAKPCPIAVPPIPSSSKSD